MNNFFKFSKKFYFNYPCPRKLREIVKLSLLEREPTHVIKEIWGDYHKGKFNTCSYTLGGGEFKTLLRNANANPFFILPVKKATGYYNLIVQAQGNSIMYTFLEDYKKLSANATPYLIMTFFDEMVFKKGIGLVRGDIISDLTKKEVDVLFNLISEFYIRESLYQKVVTFNKESHNFKHDEHIDFCMKYYL